MTTQDVGDIPVIVDAVGHPASGLEDSTRPTSPEPRLLSHQVLAIAEADALPVYEDMSPYEIKLWLDDAGWHVEYHVRRTSRFLTGGGPHYVIHPDTGEILSKKYYQ